MLKVFLQIILGLNQLPLPQEIPFSLKPLPGHFMGNPLSFRLLDVIYTYSMCLLISSFISCYDLSAKVDVNVMQLYDV